MQPKSKRILVAFLAVVLVLALSAGLLFVFLPNILRKPGKVAELSEDDFMFSYVSPLAYSVGTEETGGGNGVYGWGYKPSSENRDYAYITKIDSKTLIDLQKAGVTKLVLNIPETHNGVPVRYVAQNAFSDCTLTIVDINMPLSVYWQIKNDVFTLDNNSDFARADGLTATFTSFTPLKDSGTTTLILPSNVWIDQNADGVMTDAEPKYRYTEYLFKGVSSAVYKNLVVMPDVVNIFNGTKADDGIRPKIQGGLLSKSKNLESVNFCTGRSEILHLYPLTFENCTELKEISLSAGVYLEDGARVFQGSSALEKFSIADEKTASAPLFYMVGADGALYTNNYTYSYYTQSNTEKYYEWWKNGLTDTGSWPQEKFSAEWIPTKAWDSQTSGSLNLEEPDKTSQKGTFTGEKSSTASPTVKNHYEQDGGRNIGIGIPENSFVFDAVRDGSDSLNDFSALQGVGGITTGTFHIAKKSSTFTLSSGEQTVSITTGNGDFSGNTDQYTVEDKTYTSRIQLKNKSYRLLKITASFDFEIRAYFVGDYKGSEADGKSSGHPRLALWSSSNISKPTTNNYTAKAGSAAATLSVNEKDVFTTSDEKYITPIIGEKLSADTYYLGQPSDDESNSGMLQLLFIVITPSGEQAASSLVVEEDILNDGNDNHEWVYLRNDAVVLQRITDELYADLRHPSHIVNIKQDDQCVFRVKAVASGGEVLRTQDIEWAIMNIDGNDVSDNIKMLNTSKYPSSPEMDADGYFTFAIHLEGVFTDKDLYGSSGEQVQKRGRNFVVRLTAGEVTKYIYINLLPDAGEKDIPDAGQWQNTPESDEAVSYLPITEEKASRYQTLISMPAKAKSADGESYVNSFDFKYHETVEIGPNAFQNTFITVIDIPDRIAKIGASAFRFSDHLQTVYLPDDADIGLNAFGQEADASPQDGTVFTAGKDNFFLIAPSRTSFEHYLKYAAKYYESGQKEQFEANYNVFPVHSEEEEKGFAEWGGKDASYDYTPYLTYEITVNFLTYDSGGETLQSAETRTFLYGMDARYVKAAATTEWANFDMKYDNNAPVWFGRINQDEETVQQINTIPTDITWSVAADGWYYDADAALPAGDWYFGKEQYVTDSDDAETKMEKFTRFIGGWEGGHVGSNDIQNLVQLHYAAVYDSSSFSGITEDGKGNLREPVDNWSIDSFDNYFYTDGFEKQTRWNRWWWNEKFDDNTGAVMQRFFTMPFSITLKNKAEERDSRIDFAVPTFQNIGEITYGEDTMNAAPEFARDSTWDVPMLTVTFDYNGFPASRIFENFKSSAMEVDYKAWEKGYNDKAWNWYYSGEANWTNDAWDKMKYDINGEWTPYDAGYYLITLRFSETSLGGYEYYWSGNYNGMRVDESSKTTFDFILHIEPRKIPLSNVYYMQYTGLGFSLFEGDPYIDVVSYSPFNWDNSARYTAEGLPYAVGKYEIRLKLHDPKYPNPNDDESWSEYINRYTPNLEWEGVTGYTDDNCYIDNYVDNNYRNRYLYKDGIELFILDGDAPVNWGSLWQGEDESDLVKLDAPWAVFGSEVQTYTYTGAPIPIEDVFGGIFSASSIEYTITRNGSAVTEINNAGTYIITITPADGYVWWRGIPSVDYKAMFRVNSWSLDDFWKKKGGYDKHKTDTLTFEVNVDKRYVTVPRDSYVPKGSDLYEFSVPIGGDYEVVGYYKHDFKTNEIPKANSNKWTDVITESGFVYDVLLRLTDPFNCAWSPITGEPHGDNFYVTARLYAGFDREKAYPEFQIDGDKTGEPYNGWRTLTRTYDGSEFGLDDLFGDINATKRPTGEEAKYTIYKLSENPGSVADFLSGEEMETIVDAGYYGITVTLNDPFLYDGTDETAAYYLVVIGKAEITKNADSTFDWETEKIFSVDDDGTELKLPGDPKDTDYPLAFVLPEINGVTVAYHLETYAENETYDAADNLGQLNSGEDVFHGDWYEDSDNLNVTAPGNYCAYVKVEAPNHITYYNYISLHIFHEEFEFTLSDTDVSVEYGESVRTQEALREAVFGAATGVGIKGAGSIPAQTLDKDTLDKDSFHFYFMKDGEEYDFGTAETYLGVGEYELHVRYNWPAGAPGESGNYITFSWVGGNPKYTVVPRELTLDLGTITGHTYLDMFPEEWHDKEEFTYNGKTDGAIVSWNGKLDDLQLSYRFRLGQDTFPSLNALSNAGEYTVIVLCGNPNYKVTLDNTYYKISPIGLTLNEIAAVTYDGNEHKPDISFAGEKMVLAEGADYSLSYKKEASGNTQLGENGLPLTAGSYTVTVTLVSNNYIFAGGTTATATFEIKKATLTEPYLSHETFIYAEADLSDSVSSALVNYDTGTMAIAFYNNNDGTGKALSEVKEVGKYFVKVTLSDTNYIWKNGNDLYLSFTISKANYDITDMKFDSKTLTYDGQEHSLEVQGLPHGVSVEYSGKDFIEVGTYQVTATFTGDADHYEPIAPMTATLTINARTIGVTLNPARVIYDNAEHKPGISFTGLPENIELLEGRDKDYTLKYTPAEGAQLGDNGLPLTAGIYTVTVTLVSNNYTFAGGASAATATFVIEMSARPTLEDIGFEDMTVKYDGKPHSITITGTLPYGVSVSYENNGQTEPDIYTVTAAFSDSEGVFETRTATLIILKLSLELKDDDGNTTLIVDSEDGLDPTLKPVIETAEDDITRTVWAWEKDQISEKLTLKFMKNGAEVPLDGKVTVRLLIPEEFRDKEFILQSFGRTAAVEYMRDGDYVVFESDGLSTYAFTMDGVAYLPILLSAVAISLISMGTLIVLAILIKKNKKGE